MALAAYATEYGIPQLSSNQIGLAVKVVRVMSAIEEVTKSISVSAVSASVIIPYVRIITRSLDRNSEDSGIQTMKAQLKVSLSRRFSDIEHNDLLIVATFLDPKFKDEFFTSSSVNTRVESAVRALALANSPQQDASSVEPWEPSPKRLCTEMWKFWMVQCFSVVD